MEIRVGKYILRSDGYCFWIEEEYIGKDAKGREKKQTRRIQQTDTKAQDSLLLLRDKP